MTVTVFSDRDLEPKRELVEQELARADVFFSSLIFDYDQVTCCSAAELSCSRLTPRAASLLPCRHLVAQPWHSSLQVRSHRRHCLHCKSSTGF